MATRRAFAYNPSQTSISGVTQIGDIAIGGFDVDDTKWPLGLGGLTWWAGPDEELGWIIAKVKSDGTQPNGLGTPAYIGFSRSQQLTDQSFIEKVNTTFKTGYILASECKTYLESNNCWTNWEGTDPPIFEFTVNTSNTSTGSTASNRFKLPLTSSGSINLSVDWGDSTRSTITAYNQSDTTHTYATAGIYTVRIVGTVKGWRFFNSGDRLKILNIADWGDFTITVSNGFMGCANLTATATSAPVITSTSLAFYFTGCTNFNTDISNWDISNVTTLAGMFSGATTFNQPLNTWNTSNVTNMSAIFSSATSFNQPLNNWDVSKLTTLTSIFYGASSFNQDLSSWDVSNVTQMFQTFANATAFNQDISMWDVSQVTSGNMFMQGKTANDYSASNLDAIYNTWSLLTLQPNADFDFGSIKYTSAGFAGKSVLFAAPNNWSIADGGQV